MIWESGPQKHMHNFVYILSFFNNFWSIYFLINTENHICTRVTRKEKWWHAMSVTSPVWDTAEKSVSFVDLLSLLTLPWHSRSIHCSQYILKHFSWQINYVQSSVTSTATIVFIEGITHIFVLGFKLEEICIWTLLLIFIFVHL